MLSFVWSKEESVNTSRIKLYPIDSGKLEWVLNNKCLFLRKAQIGPCKKAKI